MFNIENFLYEVGEIFILCHVTYKFVKILENSLSINTFHTYIILIFVTLRLIPVYFLCFNPTSPTLHKIRYVIFTSIHFKNRTTIQMQIGIYLLTNIALKV